MKSDSDFYRGFFIAPSNLNVLEAVVPRISPGRHALFALNLRTASTPLSHEIQNRYQQLYSWGSGRPGLPQANWAMLRRGRPRQLCRESTKLISNVPAN